MKYKISVIIATTAARPELSQCLASLVLDPRIEYIVVNNSNRKIKTPSHIRVVSEKSIGLSRARNKGLVVARGEYVAYIDDDAIMDSKWPEQCLAFIKYHKNVIAFGGGYCRHVKTAIPFWVPQNYSSMDLGNKVKKLELGKEWLSGTNMVFQKKALQAVGGFDSSLGMRGNATSYGEEIDVQIKIHQKGWAVYYAPRLRVSHLLRTDKINIIWMIKDAYVRGEISSRLKSEHPEFFKSKTKTFEHQHKHHNLAQKITYYLLLISFACGAIKEKFFS